MQRTIAAALGLVVVAFVVLPATAGGQTNQRCDGKVATIVGTSGDDVIMGTDGKDVIVGLGGNDRIIAGRGNDVICGGTGRDRISGGAGRDLILGGSGNDRLGGGSAADVLQGGPGNDRLAGNGGDDTLAGEGGRDRFAGGDGSDECLIDTGDGLQGSCERGNWKRFEGVGDAVVNPSLSNGFVVLRHCFPFIDRCDPHFVAEMTLDGALAFDALGIQAFNADGDLIVSYGDAADVVEGEFLFAEKPASIEIDSGGGPWQITFVERSGVVPGGRTVSGSGNRVYLVDDPISGLGAATVGWNGFGNFAVVGVSPSDGRDLLVNEVRFSDVDTPPFTIETVPRPGMELVQVLSDGGSWTVSLTD